MSAILLLTYSCNNNLLQQCITGIRTHNPTIPICIVDSYEGNHTAFLQGHSNIKYFYTGFNGYELGNLISGYTHYKEYDDFLVLHDSCICTAPIPEIKMNNQLFVANKLDIAPALKITEQWVNSLSLSSQQLASFQQSWNICQGLMGRFSRKLIEQFIDIGLSRIKVTSKIEAVASEGLFGFLLSLFSPESQPVHPSRICEYVSGNLPWIWLYKIPACRGNTFQATRYVSIKNTFGPEFQVQLLLSKNSHLDLYQKLLETKVTWYEGNNPCYLNFIDVPSLNELDERQYISGYSLGHFVYIIFTCPKQASELLEKKLKN